ncbi:GntR family transcriptional regulator [Streptomyces orinoci]|uniref:GntR family transcriptional regulator n=1 Tax=Streptomyces orinoci TaxID=67339 RepID=A0ABV3JQ99_STRON|nr:GntR family transcriptional regulator [Streptomyces orinoci]
MTEGGSTGYQEMAGTLRSQIASGSLRTGDRLPSEAELSKTFGVARDTARRALLALEADGLARVVKGRGRFVQDPKQRSLPATTKREEVAAALRAKIRSGQLTVGALLPSEAGLCKEYGVSRSTARQVFADLEREGLASGSQGARRVVTAPADFHDDGDRSTAWKVYGERPIYENQWVTVAMADIETPDGERFEHHKVYLPAAAMTAMLDDQNRVFLMWRHRFVPDKWNWELPGGLIDEGEDPAVTAAREILEETGYRPKGELEHVASFEPMIGTVTSPHHVYVARGVEYVAEPTEVNESQRTAWIPLSKVPELIKAGEIANSGTLVALLHLLATTEHRSRAA